MPSLTSNYYLSACAKAGHCFHEQTRKACPPGAQSLREATGFLLNKKAFLQQDTAPVGSHLALCNENKRGTLLTGFPQTELQLHALEVQKQEEVSRAGEGVEEWGHTLDGGSAQQDLEGIWQELGTLPPCTFSHLFKQDSSGGGVSCTKVSMSKPRCPQKGFHS